MHNMDKLEINSFECIMKYLNEKDQMAFVSTCSKTLYLGYLSKYKGYIKWNNQKNVYIKRLIIRNEMTNEKIDSIYGIEEINFVNIQKNFLKDVSLPLSLNKLEFNVIVNNELNDFTSLKILVNLKELHINSIIDKLQLKNILLPKNLEIFNTDAVYIKKDIFKNLENLKILSIIYDKLNRSKNNIHELILPSCIKKLFIINAIVYNYNFLNKLSNLEILILNRSTITNLVVVKIPNTLYLIGLVNVYADLNRKYYSDQKLISKIKNVKYLYIDKQSDKYIIIKNCNTKIVNQHKFKFSSLNKLPNT
ncbi:ORF MSV227 leucine rich repeat gene family protein, similar to Amsacta moorei entomopoxvirus Q3 ORF SW:P28854 [Melanoplus sanguinipes entomopoxvirus]|uniref:ORF MSV227 leucine rich repeat gene family protein, similar to Amsacta moorei entomopoxvirus Q3 ORF SW:P28854 n=1 Tax=Melanoplus sanguinipes entomopoxvirus TaxID=83191 RepID=Q9YVL5_MSEPV|nr:ORF MSV227 leucine rich repeat gene family protein, similar to Amsacta moorei entomopoxvirus Q3 ORF SW:P28854 [Melanoplus sanguinipes entomopoxvirus]AAC97871.1 ORF MSV227 leucine rich repeat gene family protein, similar to Amsacta moorei entomopoxvirus Q3 ORF SW:P28854 [Melanoplus sanguinipes entomopoxvirus 'O']